MADLTCWSVSLEPGMVVVHWRCSLISPDNISFRMRMLSDRRILILTDILITRVWGNFLRVCPIDLYSLICQRNPDASTGNFMVHIRCTPMLDWCPTLTMNQWYLSAIIYELVVSSNVSHVITPTKAHNTNVVIAEKWIEILRPDLHGNCLQTPA